MKKYLFLLIAMLMSVSAFTLVGCSSDDDDDNPSSSNTIQINGMLFKREVSMRKMVKANLVLVYSTKLVTLKTVGFINSLTRIQKSQR